ncbi:hypothetical protein [Microseira sp. BLCC-F43]
MALNFCLSPDNSFLTVLRRHHPELAPALVGVENGFAPWRRLGTPVK